MNHLSCSSYQKSLSVVHAVVAAPDLPEIITGTLPEAFDTGICNGSILATTPVKNSPEPGEDYLLSNYQPVTHTSILPVHRLLF